MLKIKKDSWHYKLINCYGGDYAWELYHGYESTLCKYFWAVVLHVLVTMILVALAIAVAVGLIFALSVVTQLLVFTFGGWVLSAHLLDWSMGVLASAVLACLFAVPMGAVAVIFDKDFELFPDYMKRGWYKLFSKNFEEEITKKKEPSLIIEYYKAYKQKWCPIVQLEEDDD